MSMRDAETKSTPEAKNEIKTEDMRRQIDIVIGAAVRSIQRLTYDLEKSVDSIIRKTSDRMNDLGMGGLSGPVIHEMSKTLDEEISKFAEKVRTQTRRITLRKEQMDEHMAELIDAIISYEIERSKLENELKARLKDESITKEELGSQFINMILELNDHLAFLKDENDRNEKV